MVNRSALIGSAIFTAFLLATSACASKPLPPEVIRVEVPVPQCTVPPDMPLPELPLARLTSESTPEEVARAYVESVLILRRELLVRDAVLDQYRPPSGNRKDSRALADDPGPPPDSGPKPAKN